MRWLAAREQPQLLGWVLRRCEAPLRADDRCWGEASYALCSLHEFRAVVRWLHDWPQRERAPAYAMANLGGSLVAGNVFTVESTHAVGSLTTLSSRNGPPFSVRSETKSYAQTLFGANGGNGRGRNGRDG
jgi:hypothetical protein